MCRNIQVGRKTEWMGHNCLSGGMRDGPVRLIGGGVCNSTPDLGIFKKGVSKMIAVHLFKEKKEKGKLKSSHSPPSLIH